MPYLGDYLGQLLSEVTLARVQADIESVRVAELYQSHPLLRHMPVPRVRLPDVDISVPVVIQESEEPKKEETTRGGINPVKLRKAFDPVLNAQLRKSGLRLGTAKRKKLNAALDRTAKTHPGPIEITIDSNRFADLLVEMATQTLLKDLSPNDKKGAARLTDFGKALRHSARLALLKHKTPPPRLLVLVTSQDIREAGPDEVVTRLRLKISEEALEWALIESDGEARERLIPE